jgi:hypothetical protein
MAAALMCGLVALIVSRGGTMLLEKRSDFACRSLADQPGLRLAGGCVAGLALGLSSTVWRKAVIVDICTFGDFLFAAMLCLLMRWCAAPDQRRFLYRACLVFGVALTGNEALVVVAPAILFTVWLCDREFGRDLNFLALGLVLIGWKADELRFLPFMGSYAIPNPPLVFAFLAVGVVVLAGSVLKLRIGSAWRPALAVMLWFSAGLALFFYVPIASMSNPPLNWDYPRTAGGFIHLLAREQFDRVHPTGSVLEFVRQLWWIAKDTCWTYGGSYLVLAALPFGFLRRDDPFARRWLLSLNAVFLCAGPLLIATLDPRPDRQMMELLQPYFSAMLVVLAIYTGLGLITLGAIIARPARTLPEPGIAS